MRNLKIDFLENSKTYYDRDWILFNSIFQILVDFVEKELSCYENMNPEYYKSDCEYIGDVFEEISNSRRNAMREMIDLYDWFIENYNNDELSNEYCNNTEFCENQLKRIVDIMGYMWT